jgi:hypothetical protein
MKSTTPEATMFENLTDPQAAWDSESRKSPYSTVADPDDENYCEGCDSEVVYSGPEDKHGTCKCEGLK